MLRKFIYLDTETLTDYVSQIEGGTIETSTVTHEASSTGMAGLDVKVASVRGDKQSSSGDSTTRRDTDSARLDRLLSTAESQPEELGWVEIQEPSTDLDGVGIGATVHGEFDLSIPPGSQLLSKAGELGSMLDMVDMMEPLVSMFGADTGGLPPKKERDGIKTLVHGLNAPRVLLGEVDDSDWKLVAVLNEDFIVSDITGYARVIGKVVKILSANQWMPLVTLPGMNLKSRAERRKLERTRPESGHENEFIQGPAVIVDLLTVYR